MQQPSFFPLIFKNPIQYCDLMVVVSCDGAGAAGFEAGEAAAAAEM